MAATRRIQATGSASGRSNAKGPLSKKIEEAMTRAVHVATAAGITDPDKVKELMFAARNLVKETLS